MCRYRETYSADEVVQRTEKQQQGRDLLLEHLAGQIKAQGRQLAGIAARRAEQAAQLKAAEVLL